MVCLQGFVQAGEVGVSRAPQSGYDGPADSEKACDEAEGGGSELIGGMIVE